MIEVQKDLEKVHRQIKSLQAVVKKAFDENRMEIHTADISTQIGLAELFLLDAMQGLEERRGLYE